MKKIAIAGGGIGGITCGIALQQRGFDVEIFEQAPEFKEVGAVLGVLPNGMSVLKSFGLVDEISRMGGELKQLQLRKWDGDVIRVTDFDYALPAVVLRRSDLLNALLSKINPACLRPAHKLIDCRQEGSKVVLSFENGYTCEADALIGADGIHSVVRKKLVGDGPPVYRGYNLWRSVAQMNRPTDHSTETWGENSRIGYYPMPGNKIGWWASIEEEQNCSDFPEGRKEKLLRYFGKWHDPIPEMIQNSEEIIKNPIADRTPVPKWHQGNMVLIGDAAHSTTPNLGQGANMAMESALVLARCIEKYGAGPEAFVRYQELRYHRTRDIIQHSLRLGAVGQWKNPIGLIVRDALFKWMPISIAKKAYDAHYRYNAETLPV